jgi:hypothetical protein
MITRRQLMSIFPFSMIASLFGKVPSKRRWLRSGIGERGFFSPKVEVETLEHEGWGYSDASDVAGLKYVKRWEFESKSEAEQFVRSLVPRLTRVVEKEYERLDQIRSGYRGAVRAQFRSEIIRTEYEIVSKQTDGSCIPILTDRPVFWSADNAWGYLSNIRVNGQPVSRSGRSGKISEYLTCPFIRGNPVIEKI